MTTTTTTGWTLNGIPFSTLGITNASRSVVNQGMDTFSFSVIGYMDYDPVAEHGDIITIKRDGTPYFSGRMNSIIRRGSGSDEGMDYRVDGPWWWLEKITYEQQWKLWHKLQDKLTDQYSSRCIINQAYDGTKLKTGAQIAEAVALAVAKGAPFGVGTIAAGIDIPSSEETDIKISELVIRQLRWTPDAVAWFDYTQEPPVFNVTQRSAMTPVTWTIPTDMVTAIRFEARHDLVVPGVVLRFEQTHEQTGEVVGSDGTTYPIGTKYETIDEETAGDADNIERHLATFRLGGTAAHYVSQRIRIDELPDMTDGPKTQAWWASNDPAVINGTFEGCKFEWTLKSLTMPETGEYKNVLRDGTIQPWMANRGIGSQSGTMVATFQIVMTDAEGVVTTKFQERKLTKTFTNAGQKVYHNLDNVSNAAEPMPDKMAEDLFNAWSGVQYQGTANITMPECNTVIRVGSSLNVIGGAEEWESMEAIIQSVYEDISTGTTTVNCGPAEHLGADDLITLFREQRKRQVSYAWVSRATGKSDDHQISQAAPTVTPQNVVSVGPTTTGKTENEPDPDPTTFVNVEIVKDVIYNGSAIQVQKATLKVPAGSSLTTGSTTTVIGVGAWSS